MEVILIKKPSSIHFYELNIGDAFTFKNSNDYDWFCIKLNNFGGACTDNAVRVRTFCNKTKKFTNEFCSVRIPNHITVEKISITMEF